MSDKINEELKCKIKYFDPSRKLQQTEVDFMKLIEQQNLERVRKLQKTRRNNIITGKFGSFRLKIGLRSHSEVYLKSKSSHNKNVH